MFECFSRPMLTAATHLQKAAGAVGCGGDGEAGSRVDLPLKLWEDFVTDRTVGASCHERTSREPEDLWNIPVLQNMLVL